MVHFDDFYCCVVDFIYNYVKRGILNELTSVEENIEDVDFDVVPGNTYCRIIYEAPKFYRVLGSILASTVFIKLYNYLDVAFENFPEK